MTDPDDRFRRVWNRWDARAAERARHARRLEDATVVELPEPPASDPSEAGAGDGDDR